VIFNDHGTLTDVLALDSDDLKVSGAKSNSSFRTHSVH